MLKHNNLMLRSERRERLEAWQQATHRSLIVSTSPRQRTRFRGVDQSVPYARSPAALQLRAMNIIYETTKERGATILIPSAMVDAMNPAGAMGIVAAARPLPA